MIDPGWDNLDWSELDRLRTGFLSGNFPAGGYWKSHYDLAAYDLTYGERIGWKWDSVLGELHLRRWRPPPGDMLHVLDWGCGSGVAGRRVIDWFLATGRNPTLSVWDHSAPARSFAVARARERFPSLTVQEAAQPENRCDILVISHVLNELAADALATLSRCIAQARAILWVEPGTHEVSRALQKHREELLPSFRVIAPCTHQARCGMLAPENERHWCHHFAAPPVGVHADSNWVKFGQRAGIDLRSLPYSFLVLESSAIPPSPGPAVPVNLARVIGRPERFKPYVRLLGCEAGGVHELSVMKRTCPQLYKELDRTKGPLLYAWRHENAQIVAAERLADDDMPAIGD